MDSRRRTFVFPCLETCLVRFQEYSADAFLDVPCSVAIDHTCTVSDTRQKDYLIYSPFLLIGPSALTQGRNAKRSEEQGYRGWWLATRDWHLLVGNNVPQSTVKLLLLSKSAVGKLISQKSQTIKIFCETLIYFQEPRFDFTRMCGKAKLKRPKSLMWLASRSLPTTGLCVQVSVLIISIQLKLPKGVHNNEIWL